MSSASHQWARRWPRQPAERAGAQKTAGPRSGVAGFGGRVWGHGQGRPWRKDICWGWWHWLHLTASRFDNRMDKGFVNAPCYNGVKERKLEFEEEITTGTESQRHNKKGKRKKNEPEIKRKKMTLVSDKGPAAGQGKTFDVRLFSAATWWASRRAQAVTKRREREALISRTERHFHAATFTFSLQDCVTDFLKPKEKRKCRRKIAEEGMAKFVLYWLWNEKE